MKEFIMVWGLGFFGILLYAGVQVWKKVKSEGFSPHKFLNDNVKFWVACIILNLLISIGIVFVEGFSGVVQNVGFAIDETEAGYVLLGIALAIGSDKTKITGTKTLNSPAP